MAAWLELRMTGMEETEFIPSAGKCVGTNCWRVWNLTLLPEVRDLGRVSGPRLVAMIHVTTVFKEEELHFC